MEEEEGYIDGDGGWWWMEEVMTSNSYNLLVIEQL